MQPELPKERGESPRHAPLPGGSEESSPLQTCPILMGRPGRLWPCHPEKGPRDRPLHRPVLWSLVLAGGGAALSQLKLAAKGGFIRVPLKEMLIVTFLHD